MKKRTTRKRATVSADRIDLPPISTALQLTAALRRISGGSALTREQWRHDQAVLADHLIGYAKGQLGKIDPEAAYLIGDALRELSRGYPPPLLQSAHDRGSPPRAHGANVALAHAAMYLKLVRDNRIRDRAPTKRIADCFGVRKETVRRWVREIPTNSAAEFLANADVSDQRTVTTFREILQIAGANYQSLPGTRTTEAVRTRSKNK